MRWKAKLLTTNQWWTSESDHQSTRIFHYFSAISTRFALSLFFICTSFCTFCTPRTLHFFCIFLVLVLHIKFFCFYCKILFIISCRFICTIFIAIFIIYYFCLLLFICFSIKCPVYLIFVITTRRSLKYSSNNYSILH